MHQDQPQDGQITSQTVADACDALSLFEATFNQFVPMELSIIIPAYNEADRIVATLTYTLAYLERQKYASEVIVVSDGSSDNTSEVVEGFHTKGLCTIKLLAYYPNRGKGYAVRYGMLRASGRILMFMDADYSAPIEELEKGMTLIQEGFDIAIGSRAMRGSKIDRHQSFFRELSGKLYTLVQNFYLGINYPDTQCGFKIMNGQVARNLFARQKLHSVIFDPEILWLAKQSGYRVAQFPVTWSHAADSRIVYDSLKKSLFVFQELFRIKKLHR